jgi:hypothetical protein
MPATRGPHNKDSTPLLSDTQVEELKAEFKQKHKTIPCPNCKKATTFHLKATYPTGSNQPLFRCGICSKTIRAHAMSLILSQDKSVPDRSTTTATGPTENMDVTENFDTQDPQSTQEQPVALFTMEQLSITIQNLTLQLAEAHTLIKALTDEISSLRNTRTQEPNVTPHETPTAPRATLNPTPAEAQQSTNSKNGTPWNDPESVSRIKQSLRNSNQQRRVQKQETAARFFQPPSTNQGFQYLYIPTKARIPVGKLRTTLKRLGLNNSRILDIHYPDRNVAALLVHNDYAPELKQLFTTMKISVKEDFNPWDGSSLKDPQFIDCTSEERNKLAASIQHQRLEKAVMHIREPIKFAVAKYFHSKHWLSQETFDNLNKQRYPNPSDIFEHQDDDENMDEGNDIAETRNSIDPGATADVTH